MLAKKVLKKAGQTKEASFRPRLSQKFGNAFIDRGDLDTLMDFWRAEMDLSNESSLASLFEKRNLVWPPSPAGPPKRSSEERRERRVGRKVEKVLTMPTIPK